MALVLLVAPAVLGGQTPVVPPPQPEFRLDIISAAHRTSAEAGAGLQFPAGYYARIGVIGAGGAEFLTDSVSSAARATARVDIIGRFLLDPFRQQRWALSAGAGLSLRARTQDRLRPLMVAVLDLEGPRSAGGLSPGFQIGVGGGIRVGVGLRRGEPRAR